MTKFDSTDRHPGKREPTADAPTHAAPGGFQSTTHGPDYHADGAQHLAQYGMRSDVANKATPAAGSEHVTDGVEAFDEEFQIREARDHRPRTLPNGVAGGQAVSDEEAPKSDASAPTRSANRE